MIKSLVFSSIVTISLFYLMLTSPSTVDQVCSDAESAIQNVMHEVYESSLTSDLIIEEREEDISIGKASLAPIPERQELSTFQQERRKSILAGISESKQNGNSAEHKGEMRASPVASLDQLRETMEGIYFENAIGR
jgi:hypothetical protein